MYLGGICACDSPKPGMSGLAFVEYIAAAQGIASAFGNKSGGGGAPSAPANMNTVNTSTAVNTQVSPQISPVFIQQDQPQDSAINASASMTAAPMPGSMLPPSYAIPQPQYQQPPQINPMVIAAGLGAFLLFAVAMRRKNAGSR